MFEGELDFGFREGGNYTSQSPTLIFTIFFRVEIAILVVVILQDLCRGEHAAVSRPILASYLFGNSTLLATFLLHSLRRAAVPWGSGPTIPSTFIYSTVLP